MNPAYIKAYWRGNSCFLIIVLIFVLAANAAAKIDKCDEVLEYCEKGLKVNLLSFTHMIIHINLHTF